MSEITQNEYTHEAINESYQGFDPTLFAGFGVGRFNAFAREFRDVPGLPPRKYLNIPEKPLHTPLNRFGLVDVKRTVELVESMVDPAHIWSETETIHHLQNPCSDYPNLPNALVNPFVFRNLPTSLVALPSDCESLLHETLIVPPVPEEEAMIEAINAWRTTMTFYKAARNVVIWSRRHHRRGSIPTTTETQMAMLAHRLDKKSKGVALHMDALLQIPEELRLIEPTDSPEELAKSIAKVGQLAHKGYRRYELRRKALSLAS